MNQQFHFALEEPQSNISVWLHGMGPPRNVTDNHLMASCAPFTLGIGIEREYNQLTRGNTHLALHFRENSEQQLLGQIQLRFSSGISSGSRTLCLFQVANYRNYCLPRRYLWPRYLKDATRRRSQSDRDVPITARETRAMGVFYICPRPVVLTSVVERQTGSIFPMNIMGPVGDNYFAFALNSDRAAAPLVERAGRVALSSIPFQLAHLAYSLKGNHRSGTVDWNQLPFATTRSRVIGIPVPDFALRVREMEIESVNGLGSHTLFVARIISDERRADGQQFYIGHGMYHAWQQRNGLDRHESA